MESKVQNDKRIRKTMKKILMIVLDGLGDRTYAELDRRTPLEYAKTPNLDTLASKSLCGLMYSLGVAIRPSSDVAHMALFGVDYKTLYTGRGPIEWYGLGRKMSAGDLAFRGNFAITDNKGVILDRRAYRATPSKQLIDQLRYYEIDGIHFELNHIAEHRFALLVRGPKLSSQITDSDPHIEGVRVLDVFPSSQDANAIYTAKVINKYIFEVSKQLSVSDYKANNILLRSGGSKPEWFNFKDKYNLNASCIANNALYNGIGNLLGMQIMLPNRYENYLDYYSNIERLVKFAFIKSDFVFLHIQEADLFGEDGNLSGKINAIEQIDKALSFLNSMGDDIVISVTADHSTPCSLKAHSGDSVPVMIYGSDLRYDSVSYFGERFFSNGSLGTILGCDYMPLLINAIGQAKLIGG